MWKIFSQGRILSTAGDALKGRFKLQTRNLPYYVWQLDEKIKPQTLRTSHLDACTSRKHAHPSYAHVLVTPDVSSRALGQVQAKMLCPDPKPYTNAVVSSSLWGRQSGKQNTVPDHKSKRLHPFGTVQHSFLSRALLLFSCLCIRARQSPHLLLESNRPNPNSSFVQIPPSTTSRKTPHRSPGKCIRMRKTTEKRRRGLEDRRGGGGGVLTTTKKNNT